MFFKISKTKWAFLFACISMFALGISDNIRGPLFPELLKYFNLTNSQGSLSFALTSLAAFCGNVMAALILKKIQLDRLLSIAMFLMMAGLLVMGLAPTFIIYIAGAIVFGFSIGSTGVAQNLLIAENISSTQQTKALSGLHGIYGLSSFIAPLIASRSPTWFLNNFENWTVFTQWQSAFYIASILAGLVLLVMVSTNAEPKFTNTLHQEESAQNKKSPVKVMLWFAGFFAFYVAAEILVSTRLALYMRTYFNFSFEESSNYVTYFFLFLLVGRLLFAIQSFGTRVRLQMNLSLAISFVFLILGLWVHPFFLALTGLSMAPFYPLAIVYISEITGVQKRRFLTFAMGIQSLCVIMMHIGVGHLTDAFGLIYAMAVGLVLLIGSLVCLNLHPKISA